jgi:hypothetical protein
MAQPFSHLTLTNHPAKRPDKVDKKFYVITSVFNPFGYRSRWQTYFDWEKHICDSGAYLITVEAALHDRAFVITKPYNERHIIVSLRTNSHLWLKENLNNIGTRHLPEDCEYFAFMDADIFNLNQNWIDDTVQELQHHPIVQMFNDLIYLGPKGEPIYTRMSFAKRWLGGLEFRSNGKVAKNYVFTKYNFPYCNQQESEKGDWGPPGGCWAYRRKEFEESGGLIDFCILGAADWYMAAGVCGFMDIALHRHSAEYAGQLMAWEQKALKAYRKNVGMVEQTMVHHWHGKSVDRKYGLREQILKDTIYNPLTDLKYQTNGIVNLHDDGSERMRVLMAQCSDYFKERNEDSIEK